MVIWKAKDWYIHFQDLLDFKYPSKLAALNAKSLAFIRSKFENALVPLCCIVDYYGIWFEVHSFCPISINSLVFGSDNDGLTFTNKDGLDLAIQIGAWMNLKSHSFWARGTLEDFTTPIPFSV